MNDFTHHTAKIAVVIAGRQKPSTDRHPRGTALETEEIEGREQKGIEATAFGWVGIVRACVYRRVYSPLRLPFSSFFSSVLVPLFLLLLLCAVVLSDALLSSLFAIFSPFFFPLSLFSDLLLFFLQLRHVGGGH